MKKTFLSFLILGIVCLIKVNAQNPVTTLQHNGTTQVYYGQSSFSDALGVAVNGDTLVLSAGFFTAPTSISKGVKVYGSGHFPDSANVPKRTTIMSGLNINAGADSLRLEGLFINGDINYDANNSINYVSIIRCRLGSALFNSSSSSVSKNYCSYKECFIDGGINFSYYGDHFLLSNSIIFGWIYLSGGGININYAATGNINGNALIENNIFLAGINTSLFDIKSSLIRDNIICSQSLYPGQSNYIYNNLFTSDITLSNNGINSYNNNYTNIPQSNLFLNQTSDFYTSNYHLQNPSLYLGTNGTQVGIYGGTTPFKEKGAASNPQIINRSIATQTDVNGNLQINVSVKAQDR